VPPGSRERAVELAGDAFEEDIVDQGALAGTGNSGDADQPPQWQLDIDFLEVVLGCTPYDDAIPVTHGPFSRHRNGTPARQVGAGKGVFDAAQRLGRSARHHPAAVAAGARTEIDHPVRLANRLLVVLHHDDGVAQVAHPLESVQESPVVPLVETDRGLVENVEHAHQLRTDLGSEPDALALSAGQRPSHPIEGKVVEPD